MAPPNSFPLRLTFGGVDERLQRIFAYHEQGLNGDALTHFRAHWTTLASIHFYEANDNSQARYFLQLCISYTLSKHLDHLFAFTHYDEHSYSLSIEKRNQAVKNNGEGMKYLEKYCKNGLRTPVNIFNIITILATYKQLVVSRDLTNAAVRPLLDALSLDGKHVIKFDYDYHSHILAYEKEMKEREMDDVVIAFGVGVLRMVLGPVSKVLEYYKNMMLRKETSVGSNITYMPKEQRDNSLKWYDKEIRTYKLTPAIRASYPYYLDQFTRAIDIVSDIILFNSTQEPAEAPVKAPAPKKSITKKYLERLFTDKENPDFYPIKKGIWDKLDEKIAWSSLKSWHSGSELYYPPEPPQER